MCNSNKKWFGIQALLILLVASCGYQLQKPLIIDDELQPIYISGDLLLSRALKRKLQEQQIVIANYTSNARSFIRIQLIKQDERELSVSHDGRTAEFIRRISAQLEWRSGEIRLLEVPIHVQVIQSSNPDNQAAQQAEADLLTNELQHQIIEIALHRIRSALADQPSSQPLVSEQ